MRPIVTPEDPALVDAYLARVATLTPAEWGRLDAIGARLDGGTPFALLDRAYVDGAAHGLWNFLPRGVATGAALGVRTAFWTALGGMMAYYAITDPSGERLARLEANQRRHAEELEARHPDTYGRTVSIRQLAAICAGARGGRSVLVSGAGKVLFFGLLALQGRSSLSAPAFETAYALVEPVIPLRTLIAQRLLAPPAI
jgi:hypothetical protein